MVTICLNPCSPSPGPSALGCHGTAGRFADFHCSDHISQKPSPPMDSISQNVSPTLATKNVTGEQSLKLAYSLLGYAVGKLILIGLAGQSLGSRHTEITKFISPENS